MRIFNYEIVRCDELEAMRATDESFNGIIKEWNEKVKGLLFAANILSAKNIILIGENESLKNSVRALQESNENLSKKYVRSRNVKGQFIRNKHFKF
jgi:malonyl CoA-acyl carrier protein transacylase